MTFERLMSWYEKNNTHTFELVCVIRKNMESMLKGEKMTAKLWWVLSLSEFSCYLCQRVKRVRFE